MKRVVVLILSFAFTSAYAQHIRPLKDLAGKLSSSELRQIATKLFEEHQYVSALEYYDRLALEEKQLTNADELNLGKIKYELRDYAGALALYEKLVTYDPDPATFV